MMFKRLTAFLLALVLVLSAAPAAFAAEAENTEPTVTAKTVKNMQILKDGSKYYKAAKDGSLTEYKGVEALAAARLRVLYKKDVPVLSAKKKEALFKKAFLWSAESCIGKKYMGVKDQKDYRVYAANGFKNRKGDCKTQAAMLAVMASVLGYKKVSFVNGYVPTAMKNGKYTAFRAHAWMTYKDGGKLYACDPTFNTSSDAKALKKKNKYVGFKFRYSDKGIYAYHNAKKKKLK